MSINEPALHGHLKGYLGAGRVAQVVEHLPSNLKALSSNLSTTRKKKSINFFPLVALGFELRVSHLLGKLSTT
jgi:hypothetical protein